MDKISNEEQSFSNSGFTLTFAIEIVGIDVWHDCNEGWLNLGHCVQGLKLQYHLCPGQSYVLDIYIWPHAVKILRGSEHGWVRTWQFLDRRWFTFSIQHVFPVRVLELRQFVVTVTAESVLGSFAKSDENIEVYIPPLEFGEKRYFAPVLMDKELHITAVLKDWILNELEKYIPPSFMDGLVDVPYPVSDTRHQDAVLFYVRNVILNKKIPEKPPEPATKLIKPTQPIRVSKRNVRDGFELKLTGNEILAGAGRVVPFESTSVPPAGMGEMVALIGSRNLPAPDDLPIVFVNIDDLSQVPVQELKSVGITELYTLWRLGEEEHRSKLLELGSLTKTELLKDYRLMKTEMKFRDHHAVPLFLDNGSQVLSSFIDDKFQVELRGIRPIITSKVIPSFFGYNKEDRKFGKQVSELIDTPTDILIAVCPVDASALAKGINRLVWGEYPLYPPQVSAVPCQREPGCTNDINSIRAPLYPTLIVQPSVILEAQMNLTISVGFVGCKPPKLSQTFSRFYCIIDSVETQKISAIVYQVMEINEVLIARSKKEEMLTGFSIDTGNVVFIYIEGPKDGRILVIWEMTEDFYPSVKPLFSTSSKYSSRIYPELVTVSSPFNVFKMYAPLGAILALPPVYVRPAVPLPGRNAVLKLGRILAGRLTHPPGRTDMPTIAEMRSFRLEFVVAPKPSTMCPLENQESIFVPHTPRPPPTHKGKIYWQ